MAISTHINHIELQVSHLAKDLGCLTKEVQEKKRTLQTTSLNLRDFNSHLSNHTAIVYINPRIHWPRLL